MPSIADIEPQPQETALHEAGLEAIQDLRRDKPSYKKLQERLRQASELLTEVVGGLNDRKYEEKVRYAKKRARLQANDEEEDEEELRDYETFQSRVETLTKEMDLSMRGVVDDQVWLKDLPRMLQTLSSRTGEASQHTQRTRPTPTQSTISRDHDLASMEDEMDVDQELEQRQAQPLLSETPTALLDTAMTTQETSWKSKSLTERYARNNDYVGFYRVLYDAQNPGENVPPIPQPSLWFAAEENHDNGSTVSNGHADREDDEDPDLEVASEKTRIKCPITLLPFKDPVTCDICHHSYERSAIMDMLKTSHDRAPWTAEQEAELSQLSARERTRRETRMRIPQVKCPECNMSLTEANLKPNPALLRKVQRVLAAQRRKETASSDVDEDYDENLAHLPPGSQRMPMGLDSSPTGRSSNVTALKMEKASSVVPQTQFPDERQSLTPASSIRSRRGG